MSRPQPSPPSSAMQRLLARLDEAVGGDGMPNRGLERIIGVAETTIRRWRGGEQPAHEPVILLIAKALALEPVVVRGYAPPPADWPPPALVDKLLGQKRARGRPPKEPPTPPPGASAELARQIEELRAVVAALRTSPAALAPRAEIGQSHTTKVALPAGAPDDVSTTDELRAVFERLDALAAALAEHGVQVAKAWDDASEERRVIADRLDRIERVLSRAPLDCDDAAMAVADGEDAGRPSSTD